jgi:hypothetical protein
LEQRKDIPGRISNLLEFYYSPVGTGSSIIILDYKDAEEWLTYMREIPILNFYEHEIYPLTDGFESIKSVFVTIKAM